MRVEKRVHSKWLFPLLMVLLVILAYAIIIVLGGYWKPTSTFGLGMHALGSFAASPRLW